MPLDAMKETDPDALGLAIANPFQIGHDLDVPHIDQYFGVWSIHEDPFRAAVNRINGLNLNVHVAEHRSSVTESSALETKASAGSRPYGLTDDGVAVIHLSGPMMKYASSLSGGCSTIRLRREIRQAAADAAVLGILLMVDSPGGTVAGTHDLAAEVARAAEKKPLHAYIEDLGASAAYWVASQAARITAGPTTMVGSIGTFAVIQDLSGAAEKLGVKVHVLRAGEFKGAGTRGTEVTDEQLAEWQRIVNELNEHFVKGVAAGRKLSIDAVRSLADGRIHIGQAAVGMRLIDAVGDFQAAMDAMRSETSRQPKPTPKNLSHTGDQSVSNTPNTPAAATIDEIETCCPGAKNDFVVAQLKGKATLDQARSAWADEQNGQLDALQKENADLKAQIEAKKEAEGVTPLPTGKSDADKSGGDPIAQFKQAVAEHVKDGLNKGQATSKVVRENPDLHAAYLDAVNDKSRSTR